MSRVMRIAAVVLLLALAVSVAACSPAAPTAQPARFSHYETKGTGRYQEIPSLLPGSEDSPLTRGKGQEIREKTGNAVVTLADGTEITAACPINNLQEGNAVAVQQNTDGTWVVTGKQ